MPKDGRRYNGDGTYSLRPDGRFMFRVTTEIGIRKTFYGKTKSECKRKYDEFLAGNTDALTKVKVFSEWSLQWLEIYAKNNVGYGTYSEYKIIIEKNLNPVLGKLKLSAIKPAHLQNVINTNSEYSPSRLKKIKFLLSAIMSRAVENSYCSKDISQNIKLPTFEKKEIEVFSAQHVKTLLEFAPKHQFGLAVMMLLFTGMRRGEILALQWNNIDIENGLIHVCQVVSKNEDGWCLNPFTKNKKTRYVPIGAELKAAFEATKKENLFMFSSTRWGFMSPDMFELRYKQFFEDMNRGLESEKQVPIMSPHKCRHTFASYLLKGGVDLKIIQELLGHSEISTTANVYTHVDTQGLKDNITKLNY